MYTGRLFSVLVYADHCWHVRFMLTLLSRRTPVEGDSSFIATEIFPFGVYWLEILHTPTRCHFLLTDSDPLIIIQGLIWPL